MRFLAAVASATICVSLLLGGCAFDKNSNELNNSASGAGNDTSDIKILLCWGGNRIDSASRTITKDLGLDGTISAAFELSLTQKQLITQRADSVAFWQLPARIMVPDSLGSVWTYSPHQKYILVIWDNHRTNVVSWDTSVRDPIAERTRVSSLASLIIGMVVESPVYQSLPHSRGSRF